MRFARVNGVVLHHEVSGADGGGDRPVVVFSNSLGTDLRIWDAVVDALAGDYRIIRYDKRGHGLSEATPAPYRMTDHVADLSALLDHLGVRRAAIVGLSVGGMIAQGLAALRPDLVTALVLSNTAHRIGTAELWNDRIETVTSRGIGAMSDAILERWFTPSFRSADNPDFKGYEAMLTRTPVAGYAGTCAALRDADLTESTRALALPVLLIGGDQDGSTPPDLVRSTAALIASSRFELIEGSGHIPCVERPEVFARLVSGFLREAGHA